MTAKTVLWVLVALAVAPGLSGAAPPLDLLTRPEGDPTRSVFIPEPFSTHPPLALQEAIRSRLATQRVVHLNMVIVMVDFSDRPADRVHSTAAHFDSLFFSRGIYPTGSMADYYYENSGGRLILGGTIKGWYRMPQRYDSYVSLQAGRGTFPRNSQGLARDAAVAADPDINYALFDNDGADGVPDTGDDDQHVDLFAVVHAGKGGESLSSVNDLQSLAWFLPDPLYMDGTYVQEFAIVPELGNLGVYAHETGHLLGLPDLYDVTGRSFGLGLWSLMAGGWSLDGARTPAHLDPWCKYRLGFINPVNIFPTYDDAVLDPVEEGGAVYRLAENGAIGFEYFLVENREKVGFDRFIPGEGLLIYHVDELAPSNNIPTRYRVGLEQADGLFQLENFYGDPSFGDAGDPYTGSTPSGGFGRYTVPDSRSHNGAETGVTVYRIAGPDAQRRMTASFRAQKGPTIRFQPVNVGIVTGNGDRFIDPGETIEIRPNFIVSGGTAHGVEVEVTSPDPLADVQSGTLVLGDLPQGSYPAPGAVRVVVGDAIPADPYGLAFNVRVSYREEITIQRPLTVAVGHNDGLLADFESGVQGFTHQALRLGFYDLWRLDPTGAGGSARSWRCGNSSGGGFRGDTDAALISPLFILPENAHLLFDQLVGIPLDDSGMVVAGAFVELSVNGSDWFQVTPMGGYDKRFFSGDPDYNDRMIYTGDRSRSWEGEDFDLSGYTGGAQVRFRFFSTATLFRGLGWGIDNVRLQSGSTPVQLLGLDAARGADGVTIRWRLAGEEPLAGLSIGRAAAGTRDFEPLTSRPLAWSPDGEYTDASAATGAGYAYRLSVVGRDGTLRRLGEVEVAPEAGAALPVSLRATNPMRAGGTLSFDTPSAGPVRIVLFDARGRAVRRLADGPVGAGSHLLGWDLADDNGRRVPAGVYFWRLETPGAAVSRKVVVIP